MPFGLVLTVIVRRTVWLATSTTETLAANWLVI
jgi:hypothetical protein